MQKEYVALEGKVFVVELLSYMGSANYGWCISKLPEQVLVMGTENVNVGGNYNSTLMQRFYFGALSSGENSVDISFKLTCWSDLQDVKEEFTANVKIYESDSEEFSIHSENMAKVAMPYGLICTDDTPNSRQDYGLPYDNQDDDNQDEEPVITEYGVPFHGKKLKSSRIHVTHEAYGVPKPIDLLNLDTTCKTQDANLKYGYPCGVQNANFKYGYPCGVQDANLKYGYPCGVQDANLKYGYP
ncbi:MAG: hypothetical protein NC225_00245, partial [Clostridium sp.]|nr:hypothetical protein [Clostridium sp.]MCM1459129.1 hypothetical protein [Bacteroides sp.]